ncbi:MAG: glycosyltransferase family 4 protein [Thiotrichales bacterium]
MLKITKITFLCNGDDEYGVLTAMHNFMAAVDRHLGWEIQIICVSNGPTAQDLKSRYRTHILNLPTTPGLNGNPAKVIIKWSLASLRIAKAIKNLDLDMDVLHVQWPKLLIAAGISAKNSGGVCIWEMANIISNRSFGLNRIIYQVICKRYKIQPFANSTFTANTLGGWLVNPWVCHLSADEYKFNPSSVVAIDRKKIGLKKEDVLLCLAARFDLSKGQVNMVQALSSLDQSVHLILIGGPLNGDVSNLLRAVARETGVSHRVHFAGMIDDPERFFLSSDIVLNLRVDPEPFGLTIVEAMMMGKPVLAHSLGGPKEIVLDGETGWLLESTEPLEIVTGIQRALTDRSKWKAMGLKARARALKEFSISAQARRIEKSAKSLKAASQGCHTLC